MDAGRLSNPRMVVHESTKTSNGLPRMAIGSKPIDDGNYIFTDSAREDFLRQEPGAAKYLRPYVGARELINGGQRWILCLQRADPSHLRGLREVGKRIEAVARFRKRSPAQSTRDLGATPQLFHVNVIPDKPFLAVPETSSENRLYIPIGWMEPPTIPSNSIRIVEDASLPLFALLTSAMHMSWVRTIGGRIKSDLRYSIRLAYNTFPLPEGGLDALRVLERHARAVLDARAEYPRASLADLYHRTSMHQSLSKAHRDLDRATDRLYRRSGFRSDLERVEHLLARYGENSAPLSARQNRLRPRRRARGR